MVSGDFFHVSSCIGKVIGIDQTHAGKAGGEKACHRLSCIQELIVSSAELDLVEGNVLGGFLTTCGSTVFNDYQKFDVGHVFCCSHDSLPPYANSSVVVVEMVTFSSAVTSAPLRVIRMGISLAAAAFTSSLVRLSLGLVKVTVIVDLPDVLNTRLSVFISLPFPKGTTYRFFNPSAAGVVLFVISPFWYYNRGNFLF